MIRSTRNGTRARIAFAATEYAYVCASQVVRNFALGPINVAVCLTSTQARRLCSFQLVVAGPGVEIVVIIVPLVAASALDLEPLSVDGDETVTLRTSKWLVFPAI